MRRFEKAESMIDRYLEDHPDAAERAADYDPEEPPASEPDPMGVQSNPAASREADQDED